MKKIALVLSLIAVGVGCSGSDGAQGPKGDPGAAGATTNGAAGTVGPAGSAGAAGATGPKGDTGPGLDAGIPALASCKAVKAAVPAAANGTFKLHAAGIDFDAVCNMTDGGWTLIQSHAKDKISKESYSVASGSGAYLNYFQVKALAATATQIRIIDRDTPTDKIESVANTFPILALRQGNIMSDNATKATNDTYWTVFGTVTTANLDFTCDSGSAGYPDIYHACGNGNGTHIFPNVHRFDLNKVGGTDLNLDVWVK